MMNNLAENPTGEIVETVETPLPKRAKKIGFLPTAQFDLLTLAENVLTKWEATTALTLLWVTPADFKKTLSDFRTFLGERVEVGSGRGSQTQTLRSLDTQINKAVEEVKLAILAKFGKDQGKAYFSEFGIAKQNTRFALPADRNYRANALPLFAKAVKTHGLQVAGFDSAFFEGIVGQYTEAFQATQKTDSTVSISVGNKNEIRKHIETVINALHTLVKVNYPITYVGELRGWGFQKEKY